MTKPFSRMLAASLCTLSALLPAGCESIDLNDDRIPRTRVYVPFTSAGEWDFFGVGGALQSRVFIREEGVPSDYPYPDYSYTGYGGVLLTCDVNSEPQAFDLSCPVERLRDVRISIDREENLARCSKCGSTYDVFAIRGEGPGAPASGPARTDGYALRAYRVLFNVDGRYALISN